MKNYDTIIIDELIKQNNELELMLNGTSVGGESLQSGDKEDSKVFHLRAGENFVGS